jgi:hypothetical protein
LAELPALVKSIVKEGRRPRPAKYPRASEVSMKTIMPVSFGRKFRRHCYRKSSRWSRRIPLPPAPRRFEALSQDQTDTYNKNYGNDDDHNSTLVKQRAIDKNDSAVNWPPTKA